MSKSLFLVVLFFITLASFSQSKDFEKSLDSIQSQAQAEEFIEKNKSAKGKVLIFNKEKHKTRFAQDIMQMNVGAKKFNAKDPRPTYYKVIEKSDTPFARASAIYFDGNSKTMAEINKTRNLIIKRFKAGYKFEDLAKLYSMDKTAKQGGDLGWFKRGEMPKRIENAIFLGNHSVNDIFMVDIPEQKSYYVILVTAEQKLIEEVKVLKVTQPRQ
ncbi:MAG: peptidylprolyl isomerase [Bacteroidota bacterium]